MASYSTSVIAWLKLIEDCEFHIHGNSITYGNKCCAICFSLAVQQSHLGPEGCLAHVVPVPGQTTRAKSSQTHCQWANVFFPLSARVWGGNLSPGSSLEQPYGKDAKGHSLSHYVAIFRFQRSNRQIQPRKGFDLWQFLFLSWVYKMPALLAISSGLGIFLLFSTLWAEFISINFLYPDRVY